MFAPGGPTFFELARQALSSTERGYDLLAPKFDRTPFRTPDELLQPAVARLEPAERVLDVCCGTGAALAALRPIAGRALTGVDFSRGMLAEAAGRGIPGLTLVRANALAMPFREAFDLATCFGALGHFVGPEEEGLMAAVARVLKPGGRFAFLTGTAPPLLSLRSLVARGFNVAMRVRNALVHPPFVMYYLTFLLPEVLTKLSRQGFDAEVVDPGYPPPFQHARLVVATRRRMRA